ncbi:MAG: DUF1015 domain-containing protein [Chloroflexi bacterium]|nr:DUF1015 domain-containing protein [Chloroflexota bacterium]MBL7062416.1 DUF1015 domain-containing protein [Dehalococcoidia bacterium]
MAEISPFSGVRYNQEIVGDMASVICPPYDVISPEEQRAYYEKSEYNAIRIEHGIVLPEDTKTNDKHSRASTIFNQWLKDRILTLDHVPSLYIHEHTFTYQNIRKRRLGFIACVRLEPWENKVIFPHENTVPGIKTDRLDLMRACAANFSPLLGLYEDLGQKVTKLLTLQASRKPAIEFTEADEAHKLWVANEPEFVQRVSHSLASRPIYIADGHHRYETALAYRDERRQENSPDNEAFNFVMMSLVSFSDPGLIVLPVHRLVNNLSSKAVAQFRGNLETFFEVESVPLGEAGLPETRGAITRILGLEAGSVIALKPRQPSSLKEMMPEDHSEIYKRLDFSIVQHLVIDKLTALDKGSSVAYTPNMVQARRLAESGEYQLAFVLNPISVATIKAIADANDKMPGKSTFFYPKLPTGLVINRLEGKL